MCVGFIKRTPTIGFQWRARYPPDGAEKRVKRGFVRQSRGRRPFHKSAAATSSNFIPHWGDTVRAAAEADSATGAAGAVASLRMSTVPRHRETSVGGRSELPKRRYRHESDGHEHITRIVHCILAQCIQR